MTKDQLISLLGQSALTPNNTRMIEAIIDTLNQLSSTGGTKQYPTALTIADIDKAVTIDNGIAILYNALAVLGVGTLGQWGGKVTGLPAGANSITIFTVVDDTDNVVTVTKGDIMTVGPNLPPTNATEFAENICEWFNTNYSGKYSAPFVGVSVSISETVNGIIAGSIVVDAGVLADIPIIEITPSVPPTNTYFDNIPVEGILVGIADNGEAIVDVTTVVYIKANSNISHNVSVMVDGDGMLRETNVDDGTYSTFLFGQSLSSGIAGDLIPVNKLNSPYKVFTDLYAAIAAVALNIPINDTYFIDPINGNDGTGIKGRLDKPFLTVPAVTALFNYGELIILLPGNHDFSSDILVDGLTIWGFPGSIISSGDVMLNADTTVGGVLLNHPVKILGYSILNDYDFGGGGFLQIRSNPDAEFHLEFESVNVNNISNGMVLRDGITYLKVRKHYTCGGRPFRLQDTANLYAEIGDKVSCSFGSNFNAIVYSSGMSWTGKAKIKAKTFQMSGATSNQAYIQMIGVVDGQLDIELDYLTNTDAFTYGIIDAQANTNFRSSIKIKEIDIATRDLFRVTGAGNKISFEIERGIICSGQINTSKVIIKNTDVQVRGQLAAAGTGIIIINNSTLDSRITALLTPLVTGGGGTLSLMGTTIITDAATPSIDNVAGIVLSEGSKTNNAPLVAVTGNLYVDAAYIM